MKSEQQKLNELLDFLGDVLSQKVIDSIRIQVGRAMSENIKEERLSKTSQKLMELEPLLLNYEYYSDHNPLGKTAINEVVKKIMILYKKK